jgi:HEAT repeat protein
MFAGLGLLLLLPALQAGDPAKDLKSKDPLARLAAVEALAKEDVAKREKLLQGMLKDDDWEVVERAAAVLGQVGTADSADALAKLSLEGPVARIRRVAAESLARLDAEGGFEQLAKKVASDEAAAACLAMCALAGSDGTGLDGKVSLKPIEKALKSKEAPDRAAAARALVLLAGAERTKRLEELLGHAEVAVRCAAIEAAGSARADDPMLVDALIRFLSSERCADVAERRIPVAIAGQIAAAEGETRAKMIEMVCAASAGGDGAHRARLARMLGRVATLEVGLVPADDAVAALGGVYKAADEPARAAIADALGRIGTDAALLRAATIAREEESPRVRRAAFRGIARRRSAADSDEARALAIELALDKDAGVRADAAVALGVKGAGDVLKPLVGLLADPAWEVAAIAAVSLGKTREPGAIGTLADLARTNGDWRLRGAAVVGLGHLYLKEAIPPLIAALSDQDALVRRTAHEILCAFANRRIDPKPEPWNAWWAESEKRIVLVAPDEENARRERYGYERSTAEIYAGLDVLVFESRGDHIQNVLGGLGVEHRMTTQGKVADDGVHPRCVFVSNCTGEMTNEDVARLAWFVRVGGYLFGSCWAVQETIERALPGVVGRLDTRGEVLDDVPASACAPDSPYLEGVFGTDVVPEYALEGAYLIRVIDPERCEVLVDSPTCFDRWGGGNLAAWFSAGHGIVLDSVNHFEEQGLARATWLKKPEERQAYAVDHLGLSYADLRAVRDEKWWKKATESAEQVKDLSVLRLITNFVRQKRIAGDG